MSFEIYNWQELGVLISPSIFSLHAEFKAGESSLLD